MYVTKWPGLSRGSPENQLHPELQGAKSGTHQDPGKLEVRHLPARGFTTLGAGVVSAVVQEKVEELGRQRLLRLQVHQHSPLPGISVNVVPAGFPQTILNAKEGPALVQRSLLKAVQPS